MNVRLLCKCECKDRHCNRCEGHEHIEVNQTYWIPRHFDFLPLRFDPVAGLFLVFLSGEEIIGAGNIEYKPESLTYFVYDIHSFWGEEGHKIMIETMLAHDDVEFVEGNITWEDCSR